MALAHLTARSTWREKRDFRFECGCQHARHSSEQRSLRNRISFHTSAAGINGLID